MNMLSILHSTLKVGFLTFLRFLTNVTLIQKNVKQLELKSCMNLIIQYMHQIKFLLPVRKGKDQMDCQTGHGMQRDTNFTGQYQSMYYLPIQILFLLSLLIK